VKVRIRKTPDVQEIDGVRVGNMRPGLVFEVSSSIGSWLITERFADPEMRRDLRSHEEDFLIPPTSASERATRSPHRRRNERR
jgi:hypothetical protein